MPLVEPSAPVSLVFLSALGSPSAAAQAAGQAVETGLDISEQPAPAGQLSPSIPASIENAGPSIENANSLP